MLERELMEAMVNERMREAAEWRLAHEATLSQMSSGRRSGQRQDIGRSGCRSSRIPFVMLVNPAEQRRERCCTCS